MQAIAAILSAFRSPVHFLSPWQENNKRASQHEHGQLQGGLAPALLSDIAHEPVLRDAACDALNTHLVAELPIEYHFVSVAQFVLKVAARRDAAVGVRAPTASDGDVVNVNPDGLAAETCVPCPRPCGACDAYSPHEAAPLKVLCAPGCRERWADFMHHARLAATNRQIHRHCHTCTSGTRGKVCCRLARPAGHPLISTQCVQLDPIAPARVGGPAAEGTVEFRCCHCYDGVAPPNAAARVKEDNRRGIGHEAGPPRAPLPQRADGAEGDTRALNLEHRRRLLPAHPTDAERAEEHHARAAHVATLPEEYQALERPAGCTDSGGSDAVGEAVRAMRECTRATAIHAALTASGVGVPPSADGVDGACARLRTAMGCGGGVLRVAAAHARAAALRLIERMQARVDDDDLWRAATTQGAVPPEGAAPPEDQAATLQQVAAEAEQEAEQIAREVRLAARSGGGEASQRRRRQLDETSRLRHHQTKMPPVACSAAGGAVGGGDGSGGVGAASSDELDPDAAKGGDELDVLEVLVQTRKRGWGEDAAAAQAALQRVLAGSPALARLLGRAELSGLRKRLDELAYAPKPHGKLPCLLSELSAMCCDNAKVVEHSYAVGGGTGSNHAMLSLGAGDSAKAASLYQIKYTGKDSVNISHAGTLFIESKKRVEQFPSVAEDAKTDPVRCVQKQQTQKQKQQKQRQQKQPHPRCHAR